MAFTPQTSLPHGWRPGAMQPGVSAGRRSRVRRPANACRARSRGDPAAEQALRGHVATESTPCGDTGPARRWRCRASVEYRRARATAARLDRRRASGSFGCRRRACTTSSEGVDDDGDRQHPDMGHPPLIDSWCGPGRSAEVSAPSERVPARRFRCSGRYRKISKRSCPDLVDLTTRG
jgi:hypothetical protein